MPSPGLPFLLLAAGLSCSALALAQRLDGAERIVFEATNDFRREQGLESVKSNPALAKAAQEFADYMARTDRYAHNADGRQPADRARSKGYDYCLVSENIAFQFSSAGFRTAELASGFVNGWKKSPGHRKNMLEPAATDAAVAMAHSDKSGRYYAVQMFGRPKSERIEFRISNGTQQNVKYQLGDKAHSLRPREARTHWLCGPDDLTLGEIKMRPGQGERLIVTSDQARTNRIRVISEGIPNRIGGPQ